MSNTRITTIAVLATLLLSACGYGGEGTVVRNARVLDGDSLVVITNDDLQLEIRLAEIDAPERDQPHAELSRSALRKLVDSEHLRVEVFDHDRYNRTVAHLFRLSDGLHINYAMVEQGHAWVYKRHLRDRSLLKLEANARASRTGLWAQENPIAPWDYREQNRRRN